MYTVLNTASFAFRQTGYRGGDWGVACRTSREHFSEVATFGGRIAELLDEIQALGYHDIELWQFHLHQRWWTPEHVASLQEELGRRGMRVVAYCGGVGDDLAEVQRGLDLMTALDVPLFAGGGALFPRARAEVVRLFREAGKVFAYENHPEPTPAAVLEMIGPADTGTVGITVDTGWFGTQGFPADEAVRELRGRLKHVHLKDVRAAGRHDTCGFGQGVVPLHNVVQALAEIGYAGPVSVEHEPETVDPGAELGAARRQLGAWLAEVAQRRA